ncbi:MAG: DUF2207 domain-containing protein [Clostridia bacterium]
MTKKYFIINSVISLILVALSITLFFVPVNDAPGEIKIQNDYKLTQYQVEVDVQANGDFIVTENISAEFLKDGLHGIIRYLPLVSTETFTLNNKLVKTNRRLNYSHIESPSFLDKDEDEGFLFIRLGNPNETLKKNDGRAYRLTYRIDAGDDRNTQFDSFYYNIIGNGWGTTVESIGFTIKLPFATTEPRTMWIYSDKEESYTYTGSQVWYARKEPLSPGQPLTVRMIFPEGVFGYKKNYTIPLILLFGLVLVCFGVWWCFSKSNKNPMISPVEFLCPKNLNSAEVGYIMDGKTDSRDIGSMFVYWANKGYLKIHDDKGKIKLEKVKDMPDDKSWEFRLYSKLFAKEQIIKLEDLQTILGDQINDVVNVIKIKHSIKVFNTGATFAKHYLSFIPLLCCIITGAVSAYMQVNETLLLVAVLSSFGIFFALQVCAEQNRLRLVQKSPLRCKMLSFLLVLVATCVFVIINWNVYTDPLLTEMFSGLVAIGCAVLIFAFNTRTQEGNRLAGELCGLRQFILVAEESKIKMLVKETPEAFYDVLPFAYVLGVSDVWINKFEKIKIPEQNWLVSSDASTMFVALHLLDSHMASSLSKGFAKQFSSQIRSGGILGSGGFGGGGSSGGGFSGGGIGGGGGGSW